MSLRLFHLSDLHFGLEDRVALVWTERCIAEEAPDVIAITGDLTMRARSREFTAACAWVGALNRPTTVEVGNHDLPYFNLIERFSDPYRRFRAIETLIEREIALPGLAIVPLKSTARAQFRLNWSKGWVSPAALAHTLAAIDALPPGTRAVVAVHHPLVETDPKGRTVTRGAQAALEELAKRRVLAVLSGHVHDPFDLVKQTQSGPVRMIGAGTLSLRIRSTPPSFNVLTIDGDQLSVRVRTLDEVATRDMQIPAVPANARPPRKENEPVAPVAAVPTVDPPVH
ncbi:MAG: metallophosphoesterase [Pseudomonadota bacterium]|nr:metallophosphoesterase [Pseudomonadota bacterium]